MENNVYDPSKLFNLKIRELIKSTHPKKGPIIVKPFGKRFQIERDYSYWKNFSEMTSTDGVGTKGLLHWQMNTMEFGAQDAFAMVVDDLIEGGFIPVMLQNHIQMKQDDEKIYRLIKSLVKLCEANSWDYGKNKSNPIIISGGETAQINTIQGFEMGITATGYVRKGEEIHNKAKKGDAIIGLGSSGVHSNGLTFLRDEMSRRKVPLDMELPWGVEIGKELTKPTNVYLPAIKALIERLKAKKFKPNKLIHGMVHITGGGLSKLKELSPEKDLDIEVSADHKLKPQEIFNYAHSQFGVASKDMYKRFNNGVGYVIAVDPSVSSYAISCLSKYFKTDQIGQANKGNGKVIIKSQYDSSTVEYK